MEQHLTFKDAGMNTLTATLITELSQAEEKKFRRMLADAWRAGHRSHGPVSKFGETPCSCVNPFEDKE